MAQLDPDDQSKLICTLLFNNNATMCIIFMIHDSLCGKWDRHLKKKEKKMMTMMMRLVDDGDDDSGSGGGGGYDDVDDDDDDDDDDDVFDNDNDFSLNSALMSLRFQVAW